jgi:hypothetical protein
VKLFLFPTYAAPDPVERDAWRVWVSGVCLKTATRRLQRKVLINLLQRLTDVPDEMLQSDLFRARTSLFFLAPARKRKLQFEVADRVVGAVRKTRRNGHFRARLLLREADLPPRRPGPGMPFGLLAREIESGDVAGCLNIPLVSAEGHSVISDIDDTIKFSNVENRAELLANTFMRDFTPIAGMPAVYRNLQERGFAFHYVTASPWQLYHPLEAFLAAQQYPAGSMHFRTFRISDHLLKRLGVIHRGGKSAAVRRILTSFPNRKFTLIGDSGEKDLEIYARCYRQFPDRVQRVVIRLVRPEHRYRESVIEGQLLLPPDVLQLFETPDQLADIMRLPPRGESPAAAADPAA